nr:exportin-2-like [Onthophagus taurus]
MEICVAESIAFENYIKRNWSVDEDQPDLIYKIIQKQLSDAISIIENTDFPLTWPKLIPQMIETFSTDVINGILCTGGHSLFKKYRYEFKSNELWMEIKYVLEKLAQPLTDLLLAIFFTKKVEMHQLYSFSLNSSQDFISKLLDDVKFIYNEYFKTVKPMLPLTVNEQQKIITAKFLMYWDANNLYGWEMSQLIPVSNFKWFTKNEIKNLDFNNVTYIHSDFGCILAVHCVN